jgi:hypothetical protein
MDSHGGALDPIPPETLFPMFGHTLGAIETGGGLGTFERLGGHVLIALEGTVYFCSQKLVCPNCSSRARQSILFRRAQMICSWAQQRKCP